MLATTGMNPNQGATAPTTIPGSPKDTHSKPSIISKVSFAGLVGGFVGGSIVGMGTNLWNNLSVATKCIRTKVEPSLMDLFLGNTSSYIDNGMCSNEESNSFLKSLNEIKQLEIKTSAFVVPYTPLIADIAATSISAYSQGGITGSLTELKRRISELPIQRLVTPLITYGVGVSIRPYVGALLSSNYPNSAFYKYNPSGHVITKTTCAWASYVSVEAINNDIEKTKGSNKRIVAAGLQVVGIAATDALLMYNTGATYHSVSEMCAGAAITGISYLVVDKVINQFSRFIGNKS